jgi:hypothetical protein
MAPHHRRGVFEYEELFVANRRSARDLDTALFGSQRGDYTMNDIDNGGRKGLAGLQDYRRYLRDITSIQAETVRRLVENDSTPPMEMAAVLEDIANKFLDMSDEIRDFALAIPEGAPKAESWSREGDAQA